MTEPQKDIDATAQAPEAPATGPGAPEVPAPEPATPGAPAQESADAGAPVQEAAVPVARRRRTVVLVAAGVVVAALVGGGVWASFALAGADRGAPTAYWVPDGASLPNRPTVDLVPPNALSAKLLPLPPAFRPGPDNDVNGNDYVISGERAIEVFKEARTGLSTSERKKRDEMLAQLKLKGVAGRTFSNDTEKLLVAIQLMQADPKALDSFSQVGRKLLEFGGDGREAPKVDGYPDARCALAASAGNNKQAEGGIDTVSCVAVQGDVMVDFTASGPKTDFPVSDAVAVFKKQLDRLKSPGESV
ncbi:hypothetical protein [Streptomyces sp. NPDC127112]|uniref:hypothetical protein n=1 Tax=Streptomyces sp. NPDC127112 TaxID=3345364 RepID=UPI00363A40B0